MTTGSPRAEIGKLLAAAAAACMSFNGAASSTTGTVRYPVFEKPQKQILAVRKETCHYFGRKEVRDFMVRFIDSMSCAVFALFAVVICDVIS